MDVLRRFSFILPYLSLRTSRKYYLNLLEESVVDRENGVYQVVVPIYTLLTTQQEILSNQERNTSPPSNITEIANVVANKLLGYQH